MNFNKNHIYNWLYIITYVLKKNNLYQHYTDLHKNYLLDLINKKAKIDYMLRINGTNVYEIYRLYDSKISLSNSRYFFLKNKTEILIKIVFFQ